MRCVFDTNVLVSALLLSDSNPRHALDRALEQGVILLSFATLAELHDVIGRKQFRRYVDDEDVRSFLAALTRETEWIDVDTRIVVCRDPKDNKFLELGASGHATASSLETLTSWCSIRSTESRFSRQDHF